MLLHEDGFAPMAEAGRANRKGAARTTEIVAETETIAIIRIGNLFPERDVTQEPGK
jgi:hypothetical protein